MRITVGAECRVGETNKGGVCIGYNITFPFLGEEVKVVEADGTRLYRNVVHPDHPGLFFVGLLQPIGAMIPLCEVQSRWIGDLLQVS